MLSIRAGSGLGDSLYLQSIVRHYVEMGQKVEACSKYPEIFSQLPGVTVSPFRRNPVDICAHYSTRRSSDGTDQFEDCCINAGIPGETDFRLDWQPVDQDLVSILRRLPRPILVVERPREPMDRKDKQGHDLLPDCRVIQKAIDRLKDRASIIQIGKGEALFHLTGIDLDLADKTTVSRLLDVASMADGFLGYVSYLVPLAESFKKPALFVWSKRGLRSRIRFVHQITPKKILHRPSSKAIVDDCSDADLNEAVNAFYLAVGGG
jgi:hypothetical protein